MISSGHYQAELETMCKGTIEMRGGSATVDGSMAYFNSIGSSTVQAYDTDKEVWSQMPDCPREYFTLAIVNGLLVLTAVGGKQPYKPTNTLLSLTGEGSEWSIDSCWWFSVRQTRKHPPQSHWGRQ